MNNKCKNSQTTKRHVGGNFGLWFNSKMTCGLVGMLILMTIVLQSLNNNVQAKTLFHAKKTNLKVLQSPSSLIQLRHKRDTFANEQQQERDQNSNDNDYYDDNYDVLPGGGGNSSSHTVGDQISERAQQIAESFKNMWQSLTDSVRHCIDALRAMFGEEANEEEGELTPEQEQQILAEMEERYRLKQESDNEVIMNIRANKL